MAKMTTKRQLNVALVEIEEGHGVTVPKQERQQALDYISHWYQDSLEAHKTAAGMEDMTAHDYAINLLANGILDGSHLESVDAPKEQDIIEVAQDEVKSALKVLMTQDTKKGDKKAEALRLIYTKHEEYNKEFFFGQLSPPLITIDKMNNKTLGSYTYGQNAMGITSHIKMNVNFVALNTLERVLEELRHEMIHQWQDEVIYMAAKQKKPTKFKRWVVDENGERSEVLEEQKSRPKDWHNKDFKQLAVVVGIPAIGDKCYGNPAKMPEAKSYNRKYICGCVSSNGHPLTIWSTREVQAECQVCKQVYVEVKKDGKVIQVTQSHVEKPGEDAVREAHREKYLHFERFKSKAEKDEFIEKFDEHGVITMVDYTEGVYQKGHNAYKEGDTHWVAYNTNAAVKAKKEKPVTPQAAPVVEVPKVEKPKAIKPKKDVEPVPTEEAKVEPPKPTVPKTVEPKVEKPKKNKPSNVIQLEPKGERSHKNGQDLIDLYKELGTIKAIAEYFGMTPGAIIYQAKKNNVDFNSIGGDES